MSWRGNTSVRGTRDGAIQASVALYRRTCVQRTRSPFNEWNRPVVTTFSVQSQRHWLLSQLISDVSLINWFLFRALSTWCCRLAARLASIPPAPPAPLLQFHVCYAAEMRMFLTRPIVSRKRRLRSMALRILHAVQAPRDISTEATHAFRLLSS